jgi:hypothetical protein
LRGSPAGRAGRDASDCQTGPFGDGRKSLGRGKIVWVFALFYKSLCRRSLWPKYGRPGGEVVVYSEPGETRGAEGTRSARLNIWLWRIRQPQMFGRPWSALTEFFRISAGDLWQNGRAARHVQSGSAKPFADLGCERTMALRLRTSGGRSVGPIGAIVRFDLRFCLMFSSDEWRSVVASRCGDMSCGGA